MDTITLRPATFSDCEMIFDWRNHPQTRQYFFDPRPLNKTDHIQWFEQTLQMTDRYLLIAELDKQPIGVLRYDLATPYAEIDIYLNPDHTGKGFGTDILITGNNWMQENFPEIKTLQAKIIPDNFASVRAFEKAGFNLKAQIYEKSVEKK